MEGYHKSTYGDHWAAHYDEFFPPPGDELAGFIASRAGDGPVLELAIGSGRLAMPIRRT